VELRFSRTAEPREDNSHSLYLLPDTVKCLRILLNGCGVCEVAHGVGNLGESVGRTFYAVLSEIQQSIVQYFHFSFPEFFNSLINDLIFLIIALLPIEIKMARDFLYISSAALRSPRVI